MPNAEWVTGAPSTPSTPSARSAGPVARPCSDHGDELAVGGAPATRTPEVPGNQAAVDSGRGPRSSGGKSRSHCRRRKGKTVSTEGLPSATERLGIEEYRGQPRVARDKKLARRAQEIADDQRKDRARKKSCSGRHRSRRGVPLLRRPPFASTLVGGSPHPHAWGDINHDLGRNYAAERVAGGRRLQPALNVQRAREKVCVRRRPPCTLHAIDVYRRQRQRTSALSIRNVITLLSKDFWQRE